MKEDKNTSKSVEEFAIKQANLVGYVEGIEDIQNEIKNIREDVFYELDAGDIPTDPTGAYCIGVNQVMEKVLELCILRKQEAHQAQLELCEEANRRTSRND